MILGHKNIFKEGKEFYIILEIGTNFVEVAESLMLDYKTAAKLMIDEAKNAGADAVKFQVYNPDYLASKKDASNQYEYLVKHAVISTEDYRDLVNYCYNEKHIDCVISVFDEKTYGDLHLNPYPVIWKIASPDITSFPLLDIFSGRKVLLSTGGATIGEIKEAVKFLEENKNEVAILHCVADYPAKKENLNLGAIRHLNREFPNNIIGYSCHTQFDEYPDTIINAYLLGANIFEKHFTLNMNLLGNDHRHALTPPFVINIIDELKELQVIYDSGVKEPSITEIPVIKNGRRSIATLVPMKAGDTFDMKNFIYLRPANGIAPRFANQLHWRRAKIDIEPMTIITEDMIDKK
jgi:sialic acid synthase SpsE